MKRLFLAVSIAAFAALSIAPALAAQGLPSFNKTYNSYAVKGRVLKSYPVYNSAGQTSHQVCKDVKVPIYAKSKKSDNTGNILAGALFGGIIGKAVTGNNRGAAAGAVVGGIAGSKQKTRHIKGYEIQRKCSTVANNNARTVKYYESRVRLEGRVYRVRTTYQLRQGSVVKMYMPYQ